jgi:hypothetical protein
MFYHFGCRAHLTLSLRRYQAICLVLAPFKGAIGGPTISEVFLLYIPTTKLQSTSIIPRCMPRRELLLHSEYRTIWVKGKGKAIPVQPGQDMRVPGRLNPTRKIPGTHFWYRLSRPQGHSAAERIMSMTNSYDTIENRTRDLRAQSTALPRAGQ